jgi:hypothetical protein
MNRMRAAMQFNLKINYSMRSIGAIFFLLLTINSSAYVFDYEYELPHVTKNGFYKIQITPLIHSKLSPDYSNLRILDENKNEVQYLVRDEDPVTENSVFVEYPITDKIFFKDSVTQVIIKNDSSNNINNFSLLVRNADVHKQMRLSGSFDSKQWFVVKEAESISTISNASNVSEFKLINFPLTNYLYYRVELDDKNSPPVDIIKVGYYKPIKTEQLFSVLKSDFQVNKDTNNKYSWLKITLEDTLVLDEIEFFISRPEFFRREADLFTALPENNKNIRSLQTIVLDSKFPLHFALDGIKSLYVWFRIYNGDNPELSINDVKCYERNHYCIVKLEEGKSYHLYRSDSALNKPDYDMRYFQSSIPAGIETLVPLDGKKIERQPVVANVSESFFSNKNIIWVSLIIVVMLLATVTYRMMRDIKK